MRGEGSNILHVFFKNKLHLKVLLHLQNTEVFSGYSIYGNKFILCIVFVFQHKIKNLTFRS